MRAVRFVEGASTWPYVRQSPKGDGLFGDTRFLFGQGQEPTDWLVVLNEIPPGFAQAYPRERTIFLSGEPASVRTFHPDYLAQFGRVFTVDPDVRHSGAIHTAPLLPWHVGVRTGDPVGYGRAMTFEQLSAKPEKTKLCSCICSKKAYTSGHSARLAFVRRLKRELGDRIDFFGRGFREIEDKDEALGPYRYHIALENSIIPHYWTEKLADSYLRNCFPIYSGAPDISDYFEPAAMVRIDITQPAAAIARISEVLASDFDQTAGADIEHAKQLVLWKYNLLAVIDRLTAEAEASDPHPAERRPLLPETAFLPPRPKLRERILAGLQGVLSGTSPAKLPPCNTVPGKKR